MCLIYYYLLGISFKFQISMAVPPKNHIFFQIDEFIKQLMTSERFEELTDLIADKAAQKIRNMDIQKIGNVDKKNLRMHVKKQDADGPKFSEKLSQSQKDAYDILVALKSDEKISFDRDNVRDKEIKFDENSYNSHDRTTKNGKSDDDNGDVKIKENESKSSEKSIYGHGLKHTFSKSDEKSLRGHKNENTNSEKKSESISEIDTKSFLENHMAAKELELNFKHLKGKLEKHRFDVNEKNIKISKDHHKRNRNNELNRAVDQQGREDKKKEKTKKIIEEVDSKELLLSEVSNENKMHEQATFHDLRNSVKHSKKSEDKNKLLSESDAENKKKLNKEFKYEFNSDENPVPHIVKPNSLEEHNNDDVETAKAFIDKVVDQVSLELNNPSYEVDFGIKRNHVIEPAETVKFISENSGENIPLNKTMRHLDKQHRFNLQTSPENNVGYHDNLTAQFFNT